MSGGSAELGILLEVWDERDTPDQKWGQRDHPDGTGGEYLEDLANSARRTADLAHEHGFQTWRYILEEGVYEALAETDPANIRAELIQVAAVAAAWIKAIDRRVAC